MADILHYSHEDGQFEETRYMCDCEHKRYVHVFAGGCKLCDCECYSQRKQVVNPDYVD